MGDVMEMGKVTFDGNDHRAPARPTKTGDSKPTLVVMPKREKSEIEHAIEAFTRNLDSIDNFVILANTKDGDMNIIPYLDSDLNLWEFVTAFKRKTDQLIIDRLTKANTNSPETTA